MNHLHAPIDFGCYISPVSGNLVNAACLDRSAPSLTELHEPCGDRDYWHSLSPSERLAALELMRQIAYGYDAATTRLQRVFEVIERPAR